MAASVIGLAAAGTVPVEARAKVAFTVNQVPAGKVLKPAGPVAMLNTYNKFKKPAPVELVKAASSVSASTAAKAKAAATSTTPMSGSVTATPESWDESYLCPVVVGGKTLNLDFDTGSSDLWVYSSLQPASQQSGHNIYNPTTDGTASVMSGSSWSITYGDGSGASGAVYADKVQVGAVTATAQAVEAATSVSSSFLSDTASDGLLGLAFSTINQISPKQQNTFFDTVKANLTSKLFTAKLKKGAAGSYDFGFIDSTKYTGPITYTPVNTRNGFWEFTAGGYQVGSNMASFTNIGDSIADTGTTLLYLPASLVSAYYSKVKGASSSSAWGGYIFPCSATLPNLNINIGGTYFTIPGSYLNYAPISSTTCFGGLQSNTGIGFSIFGDIFLKSVFAVFDQTQSSPRLGFAKQT